MHAFTIILLGKLRGTWGRGKLDNSAELCRTESHIEKEKILLPQIKKEYWIFQGKKEGWKVTFISERSIVYMINLGATSKLNRRLTDGFIWFLCRPVVFCFRTIETRQNQTERLSTNGFGFEVIP